MASNGDRLVGKFTERALMKRAEEVVTEKSKTSEIFDAEAEKILARDLGKYEQAVDKAVTVKPTPNQFSAMVSLCYNIGPGNFAGSSVVRRLNAGDVKGAAEAFLLWNKVHGRALAGLTRRREAERKLFLTPE